MKSRTKYLSVAAAAMLCGAAFAQQNTLISFSTSSVLGDTYADGSVVQKGEWYALCWSSDGTFAGLDATGEAIAAGDEVLAKFPLAKVVDGKGYCPKTVVEIDSNYKSDGFFFVYLLDTRGGTDNTVYASGDVSRPFSVNSATEVVGVTAAATAVTISNVSTAGKAVTEASIKGLGVENPRVVGINPVGDQVLIEVENMSPYIRYNVKKGASVSAITSLATETTPQTGDLEGNSVVFPVAKDEARFFQVVQQPLTVTEE